MPFYDREFDVYVILGDSAKEPPWREGIWGRIAPALASDSIARPGRGALHTTQDGERIP